MVIRCDIEEASSLVVDGLADNDDTVLLLRRIVKLLEASANVDVANRQRIIVDALAGGMTLGAVTTVSSVSNLAAIAGLDQRQFHDMARTAYNTGVRAQLNFLPSVTVLGA